MKGFADLVKACWEIQNKYNLSDREVSELLERVNGRYKEKVKVNEAKEREHISDLFSRTLRVIKENNKVGD